MTDEPIIRDCQTHRGQLGIDVPGLGTTCDCPPFIPLEAVELIAQAPAEPTCFDTTHDHSTSSCQGPADGPETPAEAVTDAPTLNDPWKLLAALEARLRASQLQAQAMTNSRDEWKRLAEDRLAMIHTLEGMKTAPDRKGSPEIDVRKVEALSVRAQQLGMRVITHHEQDGSVTIRVETRDSRAE